MFNFIMGVRERGIDMNAEAAMKKLLNTVLAEDNREGREQDCWEWNAGVLVYGILNAYEQTQDGLYLDYITDWVERNSRERFYGSVNAVIPCCAALKLYQLTGAEKYKELCDIYADWAMNQSIKTANGGIAHVWSVGGLEDYKNQLWADSVFMAGIFLVAYAKHIRDDALLDFALGQIRIHTDSLLDEEADLFYHGYHCNEKKHMGQHWGRGNGWVAVTLATVMALLGKDVSDGKFHALFIRVMEKAYVCRSENQLLRTIIDFEESYEEATASMLFGYAADLGAKAGVLDGRFSKWSEDILKHLDFLDNGAVKYTSGGTDCFLEREPYLQIKFRQSSFADGITFMFLSRFVST